MAILESYRSSRQLPGIVVSAVLAAAFVFMAPGTSAVAAIEKTPRSTNQSYVLQDNLAIAPAGTLNRARWDGDTFVISTREYLSAYCWGDTSRVTLQVKTNGRWKTVERSRPKESSGCEGETPYATKWRWTGEPGRTYSVREVPSRGKPAYYDVRWYQKSGGGGGGSGGGGGGSGGGGGTDPVAECRRYYNMLALEAMANGDVYMYLYYREQASRC